MATTYERLFGADPSTFRHPAGLTSSQAWRAVDRYSPYKHSREYDPSPDYQVAMAMHGACSPTGKHAEHVQHQNAELHKQIPGSQPSCRPIFSTSCTPSHMRTARSTNPLNPAYVLPGSSEPTRLTLPPAASTCGASNRSSSLRARDRPQSSSLDTRYGMRRHAVPVPGASACMLCIRKEKSIQ